MSRADRRRRSQAAPASSPAFRQVGALQVGLTTSSLRVDSSRLEAPEQAYDADVAWLEYQAGAASFVFAKFSRGVESTLHSRLEVRYPAENIVNTFWKTSSEFLRRLRDYVANWPAEAIRRADIPREWRAEKAHSEWANLSNLSHAGSEAAIDFYHLSPVAISRYMRNGSLDGLKVNGVVRVCLTSFALYSLLTDVEPQVERIRSDVPKSEVEEEQRDVDEGTLDEASNG